LLNVTAAALSRSLLWRKNEEYKAKKKTKHASRTQSREQFYVYQTFLFVIAPLNDFSKWHFDFLNPELMSFYIYLMLEISGAELNNIPMAVHIHANSASHVHTRSSVQTIASKANSDFSHSLS